MERSAAADPKGETIPSTIGRQGKVRVLAPGSPCNCCSEVARGQGRDRFWLVGMLLLVLVALVRRGLQRGRNVVSVGSGMALAGLLGALPAGAQQWLLPAEIGGRLEVRKPLPHAASAPEESGPERAAGSGPEASAAPSRATAPAPAPARVGSWQVFDLSWSGPTEVCGQVVVSGVRSFGAGTFCVQASEGTGELSGEVRTYSGAPAGRLAGRVGSRGAEVELRMGGDGERVVVPIVPRSAEQWQRVYAELIERRAIPAESEAVQESAP